MGLDLVPEAHVPFEEFWSLGLRILGFHDGSGLGVGI